MEYEIERTICKKCEGEVKCTKMCEIHMCKSMINYITNVDMSETRIGEFSSRVYGGKQDLVVSGHQVYGSSLETGSILTDISTTLDATKKFQSAYGRTAVQLLNMSMEQLGLTVEYAQSIANLVSKLNSNKVVIVPFKPTTPCIVATPNAYQSETEATIETIVWRTNKETHKLEATLKFKPSKAAGDGQLLTYKMSEYLDKFRLKGLSLPSKGEKRDNNIIRVTDYGIIKPIEVAHKNLKIAVDCTYAYCTTDSITKIIGGWNPNGDLVIIDNIKDKAMTKITENMSFIKSHRRYIAPYMLHEANTLEV